MKAKEVRNLLRISAPTLKKYREEGWIKAKVLPSGHYEYDNDSVYDYLNCNLPRKTIIYARVSTNKQKKDLENQVNLLKQYCFNNGYQINGLYTDIASGISFEKRKGFFELLDEVIDKKVKKVIITYKDRLSRVGFDLFKHLFAKYGCEIEVISEIGNEKLDSEEIFEEIISLLHCYSMKLYSKRRGNELKKVLDLK